MVDITIPHGTNSGHRRHTRQINSCVCFSCLMAHRKHWRDERVNKNFKIKSARKAWRERRKEGLPNPSLRKPVEQLTKRWAKIYENGTEKYSKHDVINKWGTDCHVCQLPIDMEAHSSPKWGPGWEAGFQVDHVIPVSRGGEDKLHNVKPIHALCNLRKGPKLMEELNLQEFVTK
jgi:5-methylcytosine-specific restriction endonuclease McrA